MESVDFSGLLEADVPTIAEGLMASAPSLKHISWSSRPGHLNDIRAVIRLATRCPRLETLKLLTFKACNIEELTVGPTCVAKPRHFSLTSGRSHFAATLYDNQATLFDHATTVEFKCSVFHFTASQTYWSTLRTVARVLRNSTIKKLAIHDLFGDMDCSISAPSLTHLDLRWSPTIISALSSIDAPRLRELAIDAVVFSKLTSASTSSLSSLSLLFARGYWEQWELLEQVIDRVKDYQAALKVAIARDCLEDLLDLLLHDFIWPGLEAVEVELTAQ